MQMMINDKLLNTKHSDDLTKCYHYSMDCRKLEHVHRRGQIIQKWYACRLGLGHNEEAGEEEGRLYP